MRAATRRHALIAAIRRDEGVVFPALSPAEWNELTTDAIALGIGGHLHECVTREGGRLTNAIPAAESDRLRAHYYAIAARNAHLVGTLGAILSAMQPRGIAVIVLKGASMLESSYGNVGARPMDDVDLLVRESELDRAAALLRQLGFVADEHYRSISWYRENLHHLPPFKRGPVSVELHHRLLPPRVAPAVPIDELWERAVPATIGGVETLALSATDQLTHLVQHIALSHRFAGCLSRLPDIAALMARSSAQVDWDAFAMASRGVERETCVALQLAARCTGTAFPQNAIAGLRRSGALGLRDESRLLALTMRMATRVGDGRLVPEWLARAALDALLSRRGTGARLRAIAHAIVDSWRAAGRKRGLRWLAVPYGLLIAPWRRISSAMLPRRTT